MYITMLNISRGGIFLKTAIPLPVGQRARIAWKTPDDQEIEAEAEVVWCCPGTPAGKNGFATAPGMGLKFIEVKKGVESLERFFEDMPAG
jgi:Tfp pilus assembly protein PilZ